MVPFISLLRRLSAVFVALQPIAYIINIFCWRWAASFCLTYDLNWTGHIKCFFLFLRSCILGAAFGAAHGTLKRMCPAKYHLAKFIGAHLFSRNTRSFIKCPAEADVVVDIPLPLTRPRPALVQRLAQTIHITRDHVFSADRWWYIFCRLFLLCQLRSIYDRYAITACDLLHTQHTHTRPSLYFNFRSLLIFATRYLIRNQFHANWCNNLLLGADNSGWKRIAV